MDDRIKELRQAFTRLLSYMNQIDVDNIPEGTDRYIIYYRKHLTFEPNPEFFDSGAILEDIMMKDYIHVVDFYAPPTMKLEDIFMFMQADRWSPNGEARELIQRLGLRHTSMSVGDLVEDTNTGVIYEVAGFGFNNVSYGFKTEIKNTKV